MTAQQALLSLGTMTLAGCGTGLVLIHDSNPLLKGLNWMGLALVGGGTVAGLTLGIEHFPALEPLANTILLGALLCCNRADRLLLNVKRTDGRLSRGLLALQVLLMCLQWATLLSRAGGTVAVSVLAGIQLFATARIVHRNAVGKSRPAARFAVLLMGFLGAATLLRGACAAAGLLQSPIWADPLNLLTYSVFIASAIGLGFAFFWRTTAKLSAELEHMASTDPLTRVYNRRVFLSWCESEQARSQRAHAPFSLLMLDFDHFKRINDTFGHHVGDQVLCAAVERIQDSIRGIDVLCRWGGEEFTVLLPNASEEATLIVAERVRRNIGLVGSADPRFADEAFADLQLSVSIGTATYLHGNDDYHAMLERADQALYEAKRTGRNRVVRSPDRQLPSTDYAAAHLVLKTQ